jgi:hypothetical protein
MRKNARDNLARFFYDSGKISLAVLVIGVIARQPFVGKDLISGILVTLTLIMIGVIFDHVPEEKSKS